jgi:N-ethylmaleimide reductase
MSTPNLDRLLTPFQIGSLPLSNRMIMAPITRSRAGENDAPTSAAAKYHRQRASACLIVTEGSQSSNATISLLAH